MPTKASPKKKEVKPESEKTVKRRRSPRPSNQTLATPEEKSLVLEDLDPKDLKAVHAFTNLKNKTRLDGLKKSGLPLQPSDLTNCKQAIGRILKKPTARQAFRAILRKKGVDLDYLAIHFKNGLEANKTVSAVITDRSAGAGAVDFVDVPDWSARHKYFQLAIDIENITVEEVAQGGTEESYVDKIVRLRKLVSDRENDQAAMDVEMVET